jgi:hypothetical protein
MTVLSRLLARRMLDVAGIRLCKVTDDVAIEESCGAGPTGSGKSRSTAKSFVVARICRDTRIYRGMSSRASETERMVTTAAYPLRLAGQRSYVCAMMTRDDVQYQKSRVGGRRKTYSSSCFHSCFIPLVPYTAGYDLSYGRPNVRSLWDQIWDRTESYFLSFCHVIELPCILRHASYPHPLRSGIQRGQNDPRLTPPGEFSPRFNSYTPVDCQTATTEKPSELRISCGTRSPGTPSYEL